MQKLIDELQTTLIKVKNYPVNSQALAEVCANNKCSEEIIGFFRDLPNDVDFKDEDDIVSRFHETKIFQNEKQESPPEYEVDEP